MEVLSASVTRALDGAGSIKISLPGSESRANDLIQNERRANIYLIQEEYTPRLIGSGVLRNVNVGGSGTNWILNANGPDRFDDLKRYTTYLRREYQAQTAGTIFSSLAAIAGWTANTDAAISSNLLTARFDGESVLKSFQSIVENYGYHARLDTTNKTIQVGTFGTDSGITAINPKQWTKHMDKNPSIVLIDKISVKRNTEQLINWLMPIGGGEGLASLTLKDSTRTSPYTIQSLVGPDGSTQYYISDTASIATYGISQKTGTFKDINPLDNTDASTLIAANALYDASAAFLQRSSQRLDSYNLTISKLDADLRPGDKIRVVYRGLIYNEDGIPIDFLNIDENLWVMKVTENITKGKISAKLTVTTVDRQEMDSAKIIIGAIEEIKLNNLKIQPYPATSSYVYLRQMDSTHTASVPVELTNGILYLDRCRIHLTTRPFRATAKTAASGGSSAPTSDGGGDHRHKMANWVSTGDLSNETTRYIVAGNSGGSGSFSLFIHTLSTDPNNDMWTYASSGTHTHDVTISPHTHNLTYGISDDTATPDTISVTIDGTDRTTALGGPWGVGGGNVDVSFDIASYLNSAAGGLRQKHSVVFSCTSGQGEAEVLIELKTTVQSIQQTA
jgi:hypothetical protein